MAFFLDGFSELRKVKSALDCVLRPFSSDIVAILLNSPRNGRNQLLLPSQVLSAKGFCLT